MGRFSYHGWKVTASVPAGPGQAADDVKHLELKLETGRRRWCVKPHFSQRIRFRLAQRKSSLKTFTYRAGFSCGTYRLGHLSQNLVPVAGRVSSGFYFLLCYFLAVNVEFHAGGRNQDVELWKEKEEENRSLVNVFVLRPTVVSGFDLMACR